jgi:DNA-binding SARP family transcriptional activator
MAMIDVAAADRPITSRPRLRLLESFELTDVGAAVALPPSAQRVLVFVALHENCVQRQYVAGSLWLDFPEERAHANLRSALWRIHRTGVKLVSADGSRLRLNPDVEVDFREAEAVAHRVLDPAADLPDVRSDLLQADLLPDWYDDWLVFQRERYRQLRLHALETLCERLTRSGHIDAALQAGLAAVASEPLRETAHRTVVLAHLAEGNTCEAIRQFELCRRLLRDQLGVEPSERIQELVRPYVPVTAP